MRLAGGRRAGEELLRAHPKSRLAEDLSSGRDTMRAGGWCAVQREVLRKQWDLPVWSSGEKPGLDGVVWKTTVEWVLEARVWLHSPRESERRARRGATVKGGGPQRGHRSREGAGAGKRCLEAKGTEVHRRQ